MKKPSTPDTTAETHEAHPAEAEWMGAFEALAVAYGSGRKNLAPLGVFAAIFGALSIASLIAYGADTMSMLRAIFSSNPPQPEAFDVVPFIVYLLIVIPETKLAFALADGRAMTIREVFTFRPVQLFKIMLNGLIVIPALFLGALLFLIPLIWLLPWFSMILFAMIDRKDGPVKAIRTSYRLTTADLDRVWGVIGVTILVVIITFFTLFIPIAGDIISAMAGIFTYGAMAVLYRWLTANRNPDVKPVRQADDDDEDW